MADGSIERLSDEDIRKIRVMHPNQDYDDAIRQAWGVHDRDPPRDLFAFVNGWIRNARSTPNGRRLLQVKHDPDRGQSGMGPIEECLADLAEADRLQAALEAQRQAAKATGGVS